VFKLDTTGNKTLIYSFTGGTDGGDPSALIMDSAANLYGTAIEGGDLACGYSANTGCGTVFKLDTTGALTVLHTFTGSDGAVPLGLVMDSAGNLYGATWAGTLFEVNTSSAEMLLYTFTGDSDGENLSGSLVMDSAGNLYGASVGGGIQVGCSGYQDGYSCGTVFKLTLPSNPSNADTPLARAPTR
jgi:uncharacterized repeat protein (TIGR03803 family)